MESKLLFKLVRDSYSLDREKVLTQHRTPIDKRWGEHDFHIL